MYRTPVSSSNICSVGYDSEQAILEVEFTSGDVYCYYGVPQYLYEQFMSSGSKGEFLHDHIRDSYRYQRQ